MNAPTSTGAMRSRESFPIPFRSLLSMAICRSVPDVRDRSFSAISVNLQECWLHAAVESARSTSAEAMVTDLSCVLYWLPSRKRAGHFNPLTTEFFPPRQHIFMHSVHTTFVGTPLPQHSLLSGQTWWGSHTWRDPSGNTVNDIHDPPQAQQSEVKGGCQLDFLPSISLNLGQI